MTQLHPGIGLGDLYHGDFSDCVGQKSDKCVKCQACGHIAENIDGKVFTVCGPLCGLVSFSELIVAHCQHFVAFHMKNSGSINPVIKWTIIKWAI